MVSSGVVCGRCGRVDCSSSAAGLRAHAEEPLEVALLAEVPVRVRVVPPGAISGAQYGLPDGSFERFRAFVLHFGMFSVVRGVSKQPYYRFRECVHNSSAVLLSSDGHLSLTSLSTIS